MNAIGKRTSLVVRTILFVGLATVPAVYGQTNMPPAPVWGWPYDAMPYWGYWYSPCYPFASCAAYLQFQILERRRERFEELRREEQPPASVGMQTWGGLAAGRGRGQVIKPTDETDVQPDYIGSGQLRDEHQGSGDFLPEFLDGRVRPSR